jgi:DNA-directed RNA polymerase subunit RPC12/RpoP
MLKVPDAAQIAAASVRPEEYALHEGDDAPLAAQPALVVECPVCRTRIDVLKEEIGQEVACPDCGTLVLAELLPEAPAPRAAPAERAEEYAILDDAGWTAQDAPDAGPTYIPVHCPLCGTLMHGTLEQVGQRLVCPDCTTPVIVPPPQEAPAAPAHPVEDEYSLHVDSGQPAPGAGAPRAARAIRIVCRLCETRIDASPDQAGELITCPECGTPALVPQLKAPVPTPGESPSTVGEYGVGEPADRGEDHAGVAVRTVRIAPDRARSGAVDLPKARRGPQRHPMLSGVFNFPFYAEVWPQWIGLTLGLLAASPLMILAVAVLTASPDSMLGALPEFAAAFFFASGVVAGLLWSFVAFSRLLAILQDTAEGNDRIENWPDPVFFDWVLESFYVFNSILVGLAAGAVLGSLLGAIGLPHWLAISAGLFFVFPICLLSMLERGSAWNPVSPPVCASLFSRCSDWASFYLASGALLAPFLVCAGVVLYFVGLWGAMLVVPLWMIVVMIYFRLLGRVAWCCGRRRYYRETEEEEEEKEEEEPREQEQERGPVQPEEPEGEMKPLGQAAAASPPRAESQDVPLRPKGEARPSDAPLRPKDKPPKPSPSILDDDFDLT